MLLGTLMNILPGTQRSTLVQPHLPEVQTHVCGENPELTSKLQETRTRPGHSAQPLAKDKLNGELVSAP